MTFDLTVKKNEDGMETDAPTQAKPVPNGTINMDVEPKSEDEDDSRQGDSMDENTVEDAIVREIGVFFAPSIDADTQLYVLQYPSRPCWRPYELDEQCEEVRLKPESLEVEVDLSIELESSRIDREFANKLNYTNERDLRHLVNYLIEDSCVSALCRRCLCWRTRVFPLLRNQQGEGAFIFKPFFLLRGHGGDDGIIEEVERALHMEQSWHLR